MAGDILDPPSSLPAREDFRTALTRLVRTYALDVQAGVPAEEVARVMDEARIRFDKRQQRGEDATTGKPVPGRNIVLACGHPEGLARLHQDETTAWCSVCGADVEVTKTDA